MTPDRLRAFIDVLVDSVDDRVRGDELARRVHFSRFHFDRLVAAALRESPGAFRRRLLLERAAHALTNGTNVLEAAIGAGYGSSEAFARAFRRAYGVVPSAFAGDFRLEAPNGIHFHPPGGLLLPANERSIAMDLTDRLVAHDNALAALLLERAAALDDAALDAPVPLEPPTDSFDEPAPSLRAMLNRLVFTKEMWTAAIKGRAFEESPDRSLAAMQQRLTVAGAEFAEAVREIKQRDAWDTAFVDALCDPPESFTFGGAIGHVLTRGAHRGHVIASVLRGRGIEVSTDPLALERSA